MKNRYWESSFSNDSIGFETQLKELDLTREILKNKFILDIGSGGARFAEGLLENKEINTKVISLDPKYGSPETLKTKIDMGSDDTIQRLREKELPAVAGLAENLPFKDETFDIVIANCSVPYYQENNLIKIRSIQEMVRVLKPGGNARLTMVFGENENIVNNAIRELGNCLIEHSINNNNVLIIKKLS